MGEIDFEYEARAICSLSAIILKKARQDLQQGLAQSGMDLTPGQFLILRFLNGHALTLTELSGEMRVDPSTICPTVDTLVLRRLVQRERDPGDRRRFRLALTGEGDRMLAQGVGLAQNSTLVKSLHLMGAEKGRLLLDLLDEFVQTLSDERGEQVEELPLMETRLS